MREIWFYTIISVLIISLISLIGIFTFSVKIEKLKKWLIYLVAFSAGALLGDAFLHLIPELFNKEFNMKFSVYILCGIFLFLFAEKIIKWHHCHNLNCKHVKSFALMNLIGDGVHNFLDGLIIAGSYLVNLPIGIATSLAVLFHEIPQEIGDFGVLIHGGFSKSKALILNLLSALLAVIGAVSALLLNNVINGLQNILISIAIGGFIYIACSDLIPELNKEFSLKKSLIQLLFLILGVLIMAGLLYLG